MLSLDPGFAVWVDVYVESHRVAADRAVLDVVLMRPPGDIHRDHDLFTARVADIRSFEMGGWSSAATFRTFLGHGAHKCSPLPSSGSRSWLAVVYRIPIVIRGRDFHPIHLQLERPGLLVTEHEAKAIDLVRFDWPHALNPIAE